jgi:hypothetical protein
MGYGQFCRWDLNIYVYIYIHICILGLWWKRFFGIRAIQ